jgi:hypothetical protein
MSEYLFNLLDKPADDNPSVEKYVGYFLKYNALEWERGSCGGSFAYFDDVGNRWALTISHSRGLGFSFFFNEKLLGEKKSAEFITVGDTSKMDEFVDIGNNTHLPRGSFLSPSAAWKIVEDFIGTPREISNRTCWIATRELCWPEM